MKDRDRILAHRQFLQKENEKKRKNFILITTMDKAAIEYDTEDVLIDSTFTVDYSHITLSSES